MINRISDAVLLLGSNSGDRIYYLSQAIRMINEKCGTTVSCSSLYETSPWGYLSQPDFLNQCLVTETFLSPEILLTEIKKIETSLGRIVSEKWKERIIDIDILFFNHDIISKTELIIPHPMIAQRKFTLVPLHEIIPQYVHPVLKKNMEQLLNECADEGKVNLLQLEKTGNEEK